MHRLQHAFASNFHRFFLLVFLGALTAFLVVGSTLDLVSKRVSNEVYRPANFRAHENSTKLEIGLYVANLYNVDHALGTFSADGAVWGKWDEESEERWRELHPGSSISLGSADIYSPNSLSQVEIDFAKKSIEPFAFSGGKKWQPGNFSSLFKMHQVDYRKFPFESIYLPIEVATRNPVQSVVLSADTRDSLVSDRVSLPGYRFIGLNPKSIFYKAKTFWGHEMPDGSDREVNSLSYSQLHWELHFRRAIGPSFVRLFLPLASAMAAVIVSLIVSFKVSAQKIGIPASILLVLAVLQDRWHSSLPPGLKYFTYMDKMFVFAYLMTMAVLVHSVYCVNRCYGASEGIKSEVAVRMRHHQRILASGISVALLVAPFVLWFI